MLEARSSSSLSREHGTDAVTSPAAAQACLVLREIIEKGPRTLTELGDAAAVSRPTIRRTVDHLVDQSLLRDCDPRSTDIGRPARTLDLGPGNGAVLGVEVTEEQTRLRLAAVTGAPVGAREIDTRELTALQDPAPWLRTVRETVDALLRDADISPDQVLSAVVSVSGIVNREGRVLLSIATPALSGVLLSARLEDELDLESVIVENDITLRAIGEKHTGVARDLEDFLYVRNRESVRPALVVRGEVHRGADDAVGESDILRRCGLVPDHLEVGGRSVPFLEAAARIDAGELGNEWLDAFLDCFGHMLAALAFVTDPQAIVVSGGDITTGRAALERLEQIVAATRITGRGPQIRPGRGGPDVGLMGALHLAIHRALARELGTTTHLPVPELGTGTTRGGVQR